MKLTIGAKLGFGFGVVIALLVLSAWTAYYNLTGIKQNINTVLDKAVPTVRNCDQLLSELNDASAALRGYLAATSDEKLASSFREGSITAWKHVDEHLAKLAEYSVAFNESSMQEDVTTLIRLIGEQRENHRQILELTAKGTQLPTFVLFKREAAPNLSGSLDLLDQIISGEASQEANAERREILKSLADARSTFGRVAADLTAYLTLGDGSSLSAFEDSWSRNEESVQTVQQLESKLTPTQLNQWNRLTDLRTNLESLTDQLVKQRKADTLAEQNWLANSVPLSREIRTVLSEIADNAEAKRLSQKHQLETACETTVAALAIATVMSIVIGATIAILLSRSIVSMVRSLADRAKQISQGELRGDEVLSNGADELSQLAGGFNVMLANLRDLTGQILSVTENVNSATAQISSSAKQQAASTKEQAATVQEITSTMQEISQSGSQIVAKAREVAAVAEQASAASKSGMDAVQGTNRTMEAIREQVEEVAENIVALSEKTQAVGEVISTVNEIAEQSNLLALNATIEAAEAGAEGSRFSVVASEMKNLADQAKECTVHVRRILGEIQKAINTSVMLTEEAVKRVESGKKQADVSEGVIRQISCTTEETIQAFQQIIGATNQQQVGLEQVARGMQDIDRAAQQTASGTDQLEQAVVSLSAMSKQLQTAVANYKV